MFWSNYPQPARRLTVPTIEVKRNPLVAVVIWLRLWINREWEWLGINQFHRSLNLLRIIARDGIVRYPEAVQACWMVWDGRDYSLPGAPTDKAIFTAFLKMLHLHQEATEENPANPVWKKIIRLVEAARRGDQARFIAKLRDLRVPSNSLLATESLSETFLEELQRWLASFMPAGKPVIRINSYWRSLRVEMFFSNGDMLWLGTYAKRDRKFAEILVQSYRNLLNQISEDAYFHRSILRTDPQVFLLDNTGWLVAKLGPQRNEALWVISDSPLT